MTQPSFLLLIPAYNEEARIRRTLLAYATHFQDHYPGKFELVVVVNGCRDNTLGVVEDFERSFPNVRHLTIPERVGKGGALIEGLKLAHQAEIIGFADADGATTAESLLNLVTHCRDYDCVIGSRRVAGAVIHQLQPSHRQLASKVFHLIVEGLFGMRIHDTQCGAKFLRQEMAVKIQDHLLIADMAFDVNLLYAVKRAGGRILEVPVDWTDHLGSTVRYFRTSLVMFLSVVRLRLVYSPFYRLLRPLRPIESWIYCALRNPPPLSSRTGARTPSGSEGNKPPA